MKFKNDLAALRRDCAGLKRIVDNSIPRIHDEVARMLIITEYKGSETTIVDADADDFREGGNNVTQVIEFLEDIIAGAKKAVRLSTMKKDYVDDPDVAKHAINMGYHVEIVVVPLTSGTIGFQTTTIPGVPYMTNTYAVFMEPEHELLFQTALARN